MTLHPDRSTLTGGMTHRIGPKMVYDSCERSLSEQMRGR